MFSGILFGISLPFIGLIATVSLDDLLANCAGENPHEEFFSESVGKEEL
ncbi:hypothetical protein F3157_16950 [Virgibacillus dakarensis]|nr:hypothetical protein [Lentibacillus populi]MTW87329.1 hypothetical protein [Virgibacillus dakarensis]